jgi:hypothetical protein
MKIKALQTAKPVTLKVNVPADVYEQIQYYSSLTGGAKDAYILVEAARSFLAGVGDKEFKKAWEAHVEAREKGAPAPATPPAPTKPAPSPQPAGASPATSPRT